MDLLRTAVVDITTLVATCHALKSAPVQGGPAVQRKLRRRLCRDIERGALAYIDLLARAKRGVVDDALLSACRWAAEQHMARALQRQSMLQHMMLSEPGTLDGLAAARQDLWRLAHLVSHLRGGMAILRQSGVSLDETRAARLAGRLRRRLRKALTAYARTALRNKEPSGRLMVAAREAALAEIGTRGGTEASRLADIEATTTLTTARLRLGVAKPLSDLALDWQRPAGGAS